MARLSSHGLDELQLDLKTIATLPVSVQDEMLTAMAKVTAEAQRQKAKAYGVQAPGSGKTIKSIKPGKVKIDKYGRREIFVTPVGTRERGGKRKGTKSKRVRNAEIAFVNEYGKKNQKARPFVRDGNEASAAASTEAAFQIYDRFLQSNNL